MKVLLVLVFILLIGGISNVGALTFTGNIIKSASQYTNELTGGYCGAFGYFQVLGPITRIVNPGFTDESDPESCVISVNELNITSIPKSAIIQSTSVIMTMDNSQTSGPIACDYTGDISYIPLFDGTQRDQNKIVGEAVGTAWRPYVLDNSNCQLNGTRPSVNLGSNANNDVSYSLNNNHGIFVLNVLPFGFEPFGSDPQRENCDGSTPNTTRCGDNYISNVQLQVNYTLSPIYLVASENATSGKNPLSVQFNSTATGGDEKYRFTWTFGDGYTSTLQNPIHVYKKTGSFTPSVKVKDSLGHTYSRHLHITVS